MEYYEMYNLIQKTKYKSAGFDVNYAVSYNKKEDAIILAFQGSKSLADWITNLNYKAKPYSDQERDIFFHGGYCIAWDTAKDVIMSALLDTLEEHPSSRVMIIGHSYGGALSVVAAEDLNFRTGIRPDVYTFGAPKICGTKKTAKIVRDCCNKVIQFAYVNDIVTMLPPFKFCHVAKKKLGKGFSLIECLNVGKSHLIYWNKELY